MTVILTPDPTLQNNLLSFGWECEEGWYPLIQHLIDELNSGFDDDIHVTQVKEKYAGLRFYVASAPAEAYDLIDRYEWLSYHVCERCGALWAVERIRNGWYKTLCDKCNEEWQK